MENMQNVHGGKNVCKCQHHKVVPSLIILFGLVFLLQAMEIVTSGFAMITWPIIVIAAGAMKFGEKSGMCKCC